MCNHDYTKDDNTLICLPLLKMVYPIKYQFRCIECGQKFCVDRSEIKDLSKFLHMFFN